MKRPDYSEILKNKIDYYGESMAAYQFAGEYYERQIIKYLESNRMPKELDQDLRIELTGLFKEHVNIQDGCMCDSWESCHHEDLNIPVSLSTILEIYSKIVEHYNK